MFILLAVFALCSFIGFVMGSIAYFQDNSTRGRNAVLLFVISILLTCFIGFTRQGPDLSYGSNQSYPTSSVPTPSLPTNPAPVTAMPAPSPVVPPSGQSSMTSYDQQMSTPVISNENEDANQLAYAIRDDNNKIAIPLINSGKINLAAPFTVNIGSSHYFLHNAAYHNNDILLLKLLSKPEININYQDAQSHNQTALIEAVASTSARAVDVLVNVPNIDFTVMDSYGCTALDYIRLRGEGRNQGGEDDYQRRIYQIRTTLEEKMGSAINLPSQCTLR